MLQAAVRTLFPHECLLCRSMVETPGALCGPCWRDTPFILGLVCDLCGAPLPGEDPGYPVWCDDCRAAGRAWAKGRAAMLYGGGARRLAMGLKHGDRLDLVPALAAWMAARAAPLLLPGMIAAPVPLHRRRLMRRRYNQAAALSQALARRLPIRAVPGLLRRARATPSLDRLGPAARRAALEDAITVAGGAAGRIQGLPVLLVDDVMTSGATLQACAEACLSAGAGPVHVLVLARAARAP